MRDPFATPRRRAHPLCADDACPCAALRPHTKWLIGGVSSVGDSQQWPSSWPTHRELLKLLTASRITAHQAQKAAQADDDHWTARAILTNPNADTAVLMMLVPDTDQRIFSTSTRGDLLIDLVADPRVPLALAVVYGHVFDSVANTSADVANEILFQLCSRTDLPPQMWGPLAMAASRDINSRRRLRTNPACPPEWQAFAALHSV